MHSTFSRLTLIGVTLAAAIGKVGAVDCSCPLLPSGLPGVTSPLNSNGDPALQCSYTGGACTWSSVRCRHVFFHSSTDLLTHGQAGQLLNTDQTNCQTSIPSGTSNCPTDLDGDTATATHHLYGFSCIYTLFINPPDFPSVKCDWDVVRSLVRFRVEFKC